ncbi:hypothetical protein ATG66_1137 [Vibrio sp. ES.051]|uniref:hypothetical protein n=1 Tax=Vibrio sp. ES.051 TaxID=1761909 RepID=UPI000BF8141A|nr:hypothetical protein [Vibrio sp. ES.051]PFG58583.1 hypothetical protein ATG66_1137 [Vibrio sp. ES.051]
MKKNKKQEKLRQKAWKNGGEARFAQMVKEYHNAKENLASMPEGTAEYTKQKKHCDSLFANAERFFTNNQ